jgi:hypothetical protein
VPTPTPHSRRHGAAFKDLTMTVAPDSNLVRQIVLRSFAEFSGEQLDDLALAEMILINEGKYRGRTYRSHGLMAMWLLDVGIVQIYDAEGRMLRTINLLEEQDLLRRAA